MSETNLVDVPAEHEPAETELLDITEPEESLPPVSFEELPESMHEACTRAGWTSLMPVQSHALPYLMEGRDIMIQSRTGSGKTGCYLLPLVPRLIAEDKEPQALVLVPTRELALQVEVEAKTLFAGTGIIPAALYGGVGYGKQNEALRSGAQLIIGTPGRILDHILRRSLNLRGLHSLIFDEADRMLSIGFYPDMKEIQKYLPRHRLQTTLFSATYPPHVLKLAAEFMTSPSMLSLSQKEVYVAEVDHAFCAVNAMDKDRALVRLIETEAPASAIIFCNTKSNVHYVCSVLQGFGYNAGELSSDLSQSRREAVMEDIRQGRIRFLVATDVAARGIDIPDLSHVFLYEPPEDHESYIHRAGRTGRAGAAGTVISLVDIMERMELNRIAAHYHLNLREISDPTPEQVGAVVSDRLLHVLETRYRETTGLTRNRIERYRVMADRLAALAHEDSGEGDGFALLAMLLDECHQTSLNAFVMPTGEKAERPHQSRHGRRSESRESSDDGGRHRRRRQGGSRQDDDARQARHQRRENTQPSDNAPDTEAAGQEHGSEMSEDGSRQRRRRHRGGKGRRRSQDGGQPQDTLSSPSSSDGNPGSREHTQDPE